MKDLLERLLSRQARLMASLDTRPQPAQAERQLPAAMSGEQRLALRATESAALEAAEVQLSRGDVTLAGDLLEPHRAEAQETRTLTTLARIRLLQGNFVEALATLQEADRLDPSDIKVPYFLAELFESAGRYRDALPYRRRVAFFRETGTADSYSKLIRCIVRATAAGQVPPLGEIQVALRKLHDAPDLDNETRIETATNLYKVEAMASSARDLYAQASPCPADETEIEPQWRSLAKWCETANVPLRQVPGAGKPGRRPLVAELPGVLVLPGLTGVPLVDNGAVAIGSSYQADPPLRHKLASSPLLLSGPTRVLLSIPRKTREYHDTCVYVGGSGNYYEDLLMHFGSLATVDSTGIDLRSYPLVLSGSLQEHQHGLMELLGLTGVPVVFAEEAEALKLNRLIFPARLAAGAHWVDPFVVDWYRSKAPAQNRLGAAGRRLYLLNPPEHRRQFVNEEEVMAALTAMGFEAVSCAGLTIRQQAALFSSAEHVIGFEDDALANLVFTAAGSHVTLLSDPATGHDTMPRHRFNALADACGHLVDHVACQVLRVTIDGPRPGVELKVDVKQLVSALSAGTRTSPA